MILLVETQISIRITSILAQGQYIVLPYHIIRLNMGDPYNLYDILILSRHTQDTTSAQRDLTANTYYVHTNTCHRNVLQRKHLIGPFSRDKRGCGCDPRKVRRWSF